MPGFHWCVHRDSWPLGNDLLPQVFLRVSRGIFSSYFQMDLQAWVTCSSVPLHFQSMLMSVCCHIHAWGASVLTRAVMLRGWGAASMQKGENSPSLAPPTSAPPPTSYVPHLQKALRDAGQHWLLALGLSTQWVAGSLFQKSLWQHWTLDQEASNTAVTLGTFYF